MLRGSRAPFSVLPLPPTTLRRTLSLPLLVFYGLGTTIGAGIFVLVGKVAGHADLLTPLSFLAAALLIASSAFSYGELGARFPHSAGSAAYVHRGFGGENLPLVVGLLMVMAGIVSSATIVRGSAGYIREFVPFSSPLIVLILAAALGALAAWGIRESVRAAAMITLVEVGALIVVIGGGIVHLPDFPRAVLEREEWPPGLAAGVVVGAFLAFYAFIGFEDLATVGEEAVDAPRHMPVAILLTLALTALLYMLVATVAVTAVDVSRLATSEAPLSFVFSEATGLAGESLSLVAIAAVMNGALIQIIMASRILYGMGREGWYRFSLGGWLARVHPRTRTPLNATAVVTSLIIVLAAIIELEPLAEITSATTLIVFTFVNLALYRLKGRTTAPPGVFTVPRWVPAVGAAINVAFLTAAAASLFVE